MMEVKTTCAKLALTLVAAFFLLEDEDEAEEEEEELEEPEEPELDLEEDPEALVEAVLDSVPEPKSTLPDAELVPILPISFKAEEQLACVVAVCRVAEPLKLQSDLLPPLFS